MQRSMNRSIAATASEILLSVIPYAVFRFWDFLGAGSLEMADIKGHLVWPSSCIESVDSCLRGGTLRTTSCLSRMEGESQGGSRFGTVAEQMPAFSGGSAGIFLFKFAHRCATLSDSQSHLPRQFAKLGRLFDFLILMRRQYEYDRERPRLFISNFG